MVRSYREEEEAVKAEESSVPDRLSSQEKQFFFSVVIWIQMMILFAVLFITDSHTNYDVVSSGLCENAMSLQCPRGNFECHSTFPHTRSQSSVLMAVLWEEKSFYDRFVNTSDVGRVFWPCNHHTVRVFRVKDTVCKSLGL